MRNLKGSFFLFVLLIVTMETTYPQESSYLSAREEADVLNDTLDSYLFEDRVNSPTSLQATGRFLAQTISSRAKVTCDMYPRICRADGSTNPDCCKKKCVDVRTDRLNCGMCGRMCKYSDICCEGQCVNSMSDKEHRVRCNNRCNTNKNKKGLASDSCICGLCNYGYA